MDFPVMLLPALICFNHFCLNNASELVFHVYQMDFELCKVLTFTLFYDSDLDSQKYAVYPFSNDVNLF